MATDNATGGPVVTGAQTPTTSPGHAGLPTQLPGESTTVSTVAAATGGIAPGNLIDTDIDENLFRFNSDDTPLMQIMLRAKRVKVNSPVIQHYAIDEPRARIVTKAAVGDGTTDRVTLSLGNTDKKLLQPFTTVLVKGVDGYDAKGATATPGEDLMLFVTGKDNDGAPIAMAINGKKTTETDEVSNVPEIPAGTTLVIMSTAMFETQKEVAPNLIVPMPTEIYAQKRGFNSIVSDYFESVKKRIPFSQALIAEAQIADFKVKGNRTLWAGRKGKIQIETPLGIQSIYTTEGIRYQIKRHLDKVGKWTFEELISLAKMIFTGDDVPKSVIALCGKNFLENIQTIDYSKHPEVQIIVKTNPVGWSVSTIHTVFGDIELKHEPTLDRLGWSNSAGVIAYDRLVHYVYSAEHKDSERIEGHEAKRESTVVWDALALKGSCHIWIDGEGESPAAGAESYIMWASADAPATPVEGTIYVLLADCPGINANAVCGEAWQYKNKTWKEFSGIIHG